MIASKVKNICGWLVVGMALSGAAQAQEIFADDFESGGLTHTQSGVRWGGGRTSTVSTDIAHSGRYSLKFAFEPAPSGEDSFSERRFALGRDYKEIFIEWYAYYPDGTEGLGAKYVHRDDTGADNNKLVRLWKGDPNDGNSGYSNYYIKGGASTLPTGNGASLFLGEYGWDRAGVGTGPGDSPRAASYSNFITDAQLGRWIHIKVHAKAANPGQSDGVIEVWRDGVKLASTTNLPWYSRDGHPSAFDYGYLMGWANSGFLNATNVYVDDVRISTSAGVQPNPPANLSVN